MVTRQRLPIYDYEVVKGDTLDILIRYEPNAEPIEWASDDEIEVTVSIDGAADIVVPSDRIELVDPSTELVDTANAPNIITYLTPAETDLLPVNVPCTYQVRFVENGVKHTILTGVLTGRFSAVEGPDA